MRVIGLDMSLTSTGFADYTTESGLFVSKAIRSTPANRNPTLRDRYERARDVETTLIRYIYELGSIPNLVVIEAPAYGAKFGDPHDRSGMWWGIAGHCMRNGLVVVEVSPAQVKQYATGSGATSGVNKVTKPMVIKAVNARYDMGPLGLLPGQNDEADAIVLAAIGMRLLGCPVDPLIPAPNLRAITKIRLPEGLKAS